MRALKIIMFICRFIGKMDNAIQYAEDYIKERQRTKELNDVASEIIEKGRKEVENEQR